MKSLMTYSALVMFLGLALGLGLNSTAEAADSKLVAVALIQPTKGNTCKGTVVFHQKGSEVKVVATISGLEAKSKHAIHVHEFGSCGSEDGKCTGGHFNPEGKKHGLPPSADRHAGDLGNLEADDQGNASYTVTVKNISLKNGKKSCILGRAIIVHAKADDGGQPTGNAGARIGAGTIALGNPAAVKPASAPEKAIKKVKEGS